MWRMKPLSFYVWLVALFLVTAKSSHFLRSDTSVPAGTLVAIAGISLVICAMNFGAGAVLGGKRYRREASQALGQKNNSLTIWIALAFINPVVALGPTCYVLYHNAYNSLQLLAFERKRKADEALINIMERRKTMARTFALLLIVCAWFLPSAVAQDTSSAPAKKRPASGLAVTEAALGTGVQDRKLVGANTEFTLNQKVFLWLALSGGPADGIVVTWKQGDKAYQTKLSVGGTTWHTWAYKTAAVAGPWEVTVADEAGNVLKKLEFTVGGK